MAIGYLEYHYLLYIMADSENYTFIIVNKTETFKSLKTYTLLNECIDAIIYTAYCKYGEDLKHIYILKNAEIIKKV